MKGWISTFWLVWFLSIPLCAFGDGCFIPATSFPSVQIPDQQALIHFENGTETLVVDTAFKGDGTNFAWIVPVPSVPTVEPATTGLFTTLQTIFQPRVINDTGKYYNLALILGTVAFVIIWQRRVGGSCLAIALFFVFALLLAAMLLPALAKAGAGGSITNVTVIDRKTVGIYETATISSRDGEALLNWLNQNGFATPPRFVPAIRAYAQEGWFFVASKVRLDLPLAESVQPHPLAFTFTTDHPVYPLRLTGIGNEKCRIDLYVFGPEEATVSNFKVERCAKPIYPAAADETHYLKAVQVRHPLLRTMVNQAAVATKLTATLSSGQMEKDGYLQWTPYREKRNTLYTNRGATETASDLSVPLLVLALILLYAFKNNEDPWAKSFCRTCSITALVALLVWPAIYLSLPKTPAFSIRFPTSRNRGHHEQIAGLVSLEATRTGNKNGRSFKPDLAWVRQQLSEASDFRNSLSAYDQMNFFTGRPVHEEDSPGNYTLSESPAGILYTWYDIDGGTNIINLSN